MSGDLSMRLIGAWRVFHQDLVHLLEGFHGIVLVFLLPPLVLGLVGQLGVRAPSLEVLVAGSPRSDDQAVYDEFVALLGDISTVNVHTTDDLAQDPLPELKARGLDLVINLEGDDPGEWVMYTGAESRPRLSSVRRFVAGLERALRVIEEWSGERDPEAAEDLADETERWATELGALGSFTPRQMLAYYPRVLDRTIDLAGGTLVIIICFLPFVLAAPSLIREKEAHTFEVMLSAPGIDGTTVFTGKCLFVLIVTLVELLLLIVVAESVYSIQVKPGFVIMLGLFLPAVLVSAFLGLAVSSLVRAQAQVGMASALYFLAITLFTGFFVPLDESSVVVRALSQLFPSTFVMPVFKAWTVGADPLRAYFPALGGLWLQCGVYGAASIAIFRYAMRRI